MHIQCSPLGLFDPSLAAVKSCCSVAVFARARGRSTGQASPHSCRTARPDGALLVPVPLARAPLVTRWGGHGSRTAIVESSCRPLVVCGRAPISDPSCKSRYVHFTSSSRHLFKESHTRGGDCPRSYSCTTTQTPTRGLDDFRGAPAPTQLTRYRTSPASVVAQRNVARPRPTAHRIQVLGRRAHTQAHRLRCVHPLLSGERRADFQYHTKLT